MTLCQDTQIVPYPVLPVTVSAGPRAPVPDFKLAPYHQGACNLGRVRGRGGRGSRGRGRSGVGPTKVGITQPLAKELETRVGVTQSLGTRARWSCQGPEFRG